MDDLTSGFNIGTNYSLSPEFNEMTGFTEKEVREMLTYYSTNSPFNHTVGQLIDIMKPWYDNYCFAPECYGETTLYNSNMVLYFVKNYILRGKAPQKMIESNIRIDYEKLRMLIRKDKEFAHDASIIQTLVSQGYITGELKDSFPAANIVDPDNFISLLYYFGMLTISGMHKGKNKLTIPNQVVEEQLYTYLLNTYNEADLSFSSYEKDELASALAYDGNWQAYFGSSEKEQKIFMSKQGTIIVVDDNKGVLSAVKLLLKNHFEHIVTLPSPITLPAALREENAQVVLLDMNFSSGLNTGNEGLYWLHEIKKIHPSLPVVLFTAYADIDLAVRGIKEGATDFIVKPWDNARLIETLLSACRNSSKNKKRAEIPKTVSSMYWGESNAMKQLRTLIEKVAQTDANILITGENGTGKEMLAREIHALSNRYRRDMITVDMGAITESLFESELFGHKKGSFTDAHTDRAGKFEAAHEGTLFLDEIGNLPYHLQSKLLTAIQSRSVVRVGSNEPIPVNIRLICATNCNLEEMVAKGKFREDLLYRINTIHIEIPPLRERKEDIIPLAERFIDRFCKQYDKGNILLSTGAQEKLRTYPWYGNIRELEHAVEKAVIINEDGILSEEHFHFPRKIAAPATETSVSTLEEMELQMIQKAIEKCNGNLSAVAAQLGITRQTLYNKMKKFGL